MKTIKQIFKIVLVSTFLLSISNSIIAKEIQETLEKSYKLNATGNLDFSCYDSDLKINTWDKNEVKLTGTIIVSGGNEEDQQQLIEAFKNPEVDESSNSLSIKTDIVKSTIIVGPFKKMTLVNGKTVRVDKFKANYTLWVPKSVALDLKSKYNNIDIAELTGELEFNLYEADLTLAGFKNGEFNMKYCKGDIGNGEKAVLDVYECELEMKTFKTVDLNSKYSEFIVESIETLTIGSYEDKFRIQNLSNLSGNAKYTEFIINSNTQSIKMDVYESNIEVLNVKDVNYKAKYSKFKAQDISSMECVTLYETKIYAANVGEFSANVSKYDNIRFESISKSINIASAYELKMDIGAATSSFEKFNGDFKYGYVNMPLNSVPEFSLKFHTKYGDVQFPKNKVKITDMDFKGSQKTFEGQTSDNPACKINFTSYETDFNLE